jgi:serpin B
MTRTILGWTTVLLLAGACAIAQTASKPAEPPKEDVKAAAQSISSLGLDLYATLGREGNLFFSPASIETALAMTYAGARGDTAAQMAKTLHFAMEGQRLHAAFGGLIDKLNSPQQVTLQQGQKMVQLPAYELNVANAIWLQKGLAVKSDFTSLMQTAYRAGLNQTDFTMSEEARAAINAWVEKQTKDKIKDLIGKGVLGRDTAMVLANAIYFKSNWADKFDKSATKDAPFKLSADKSVDVPMMHQESKFRYGQADELDLVELPYVGNELSMVILLPRKIDALADVEKSLNAQNLDKWLKGLKRETVSLTMPRFKFTSELSLAQSLKTMGMPDAFDPNKADFSGMSDAEKLFISAVLHKALVAVDEEGTEAAAATAVVMALTAAPMPQEPKVFKADHPFVFLIRHNSTGAILFMGRLANPR